MLDEGEIEDGVAIIGHRRGADITEGWEIERLRAAPLGDAGKTEDAEGVEGIAIADEERFYFVTDEDEGVHLRLTRLLAD